MTSGLAITEQALARTRNRAALALLASGLESRSSEVRQAAIRATLRRRDILSHTQLIAHFHELDDADRDVLRATHQAMPHHAAAALKAALLRGDAALCRNACDIVHHCRDHDLFATLLKALEQPQHRHAQKISTTIVQFAIDLHDEVVAWARGDRNRRDPSFARRQVLLALERGLKRKTEYNPAGVIDAFLLLAPVDNHTLLEIIRKSNHPCHYQLISSLGSSRTKAVMERLVAFLHDSDAPAAAIEAIGRRSDGAFADYLLHELKHPVSLRVLHNMKRMRTVKWLEEKQGRLLEFEGRVQAIAVDLAMASSIDRDAQFSLLALLMRQGLGEGRRASCNALAEFRSPEANELIVAALKDPDASVQAAALRQLRPRRMPNALGLLVASLESSQVEVRDAARSSLAEFNFVRYRAMFDLLDDVALRSTGSLVRQVDQTASEKLCEELAAPSASTKLRGIEMAVAMGAVDDVCEQLIGLCRHENVAVRKEAVAALAFATSENAEEALNFAARDENRSVADAARQSLARQRFTPLNSGLPPTTFEVLR